jgi:hypothetical protein
VDKLDSDFGPVALKTNDFAAMFTFASGEDGLRFVFPTEDSKGDYITVESLRRDKRDMTGIIACCVYDEIIEIQGAMRDGRQEQKIRRSK